MFILCVCNRYKTGHAFTWNVLLVPHPLPPQSESQRQTPSQYEQRIYFECAYQYTQCFFFVPIATHLHIPERGRRSALLALQQREEGVVRMGRDRALLLRHPQPSRTLLHHRPVMMTSTHTHAGFCKTWSQSNCPGSHFLYVHNIKTRTCDVKHLKCSLGFKDGKRKELIG